jgi:hypothetical protein
MQTILRLGTPVSWLLALTLSLAISPWQAFCAEDAPSEEAVAELVEEFGAPQKARREEAEKKLIALGPKVVDLLPKSGPDVTEEVASRLGRVRMALYRKRAEASVAASSVTLSVKDAPLDEVFKAITKQTGNQLVDFRDQFGQQPTPVKLTLDVAKQPFWKTIDELTAQSDLEVYHFSGTDELALVAGAKGKPKPAAGATEAVCYSEAFRIEAKRLIVSRSPTSAEPGELRVELEVAWEPRLKPLFLTSKMANVEALDDAGKPIEPGNRELSAEIPPQGKSCRAEIALAFQAPPRSAKSVKSLSGTLEVLVPAEMHPFRFTKLDEGKREQKAAAVTVSIDAPRANNDLLQIALTLKYENPANAMESHRAWFYKNPCYLEASDGTKSPPGTIELTRQSNDELTLNLLFAPDGDWKKQTLVYQTPADIVVQPIEYRFKELPLP